MLSYDASSALSTSKPWETDLCPTALLEWKQFRRRALSGWDVGAAMTLSDELTSVAWWKCWGWCVFYGQRFFSVEFFAVHDEVPLLLTTPDNVPLLKLWNAVKVLCWFCCYSMKGLCLVLLNGEVAWMWQAQEETGSLARNKLYLVTTGFILFCLMTL